MIIRQELALTSLVIHFAALQNCKYICNTSGMDARRICRYLCAHADTVFLTVNKHIHLCLHFSLPHRPHKKKQAHILNAKPEERPCSNHKSTFLSIVHSGNKNFKKLEAQDLRCHTFYSQLRVKLTIGGIS